MTTGYILLLTPSFLALAGFLGTGNTFFAAAHMALFVLALIVAFCDRLIHMDVRNLTLVEIFWALYLAVLMMGILVGSENRLDYDTVGALRLWVGALAMSALMLVLPALINSRSSLHACIGALDFVGVLISSSVYLPVLGFNFGELPGGSTGLLRVFGVFGDSVAFAVTLFVCRSFVARRWGPFAFHLGALMLTAGIGALLTLSVAMLAHLVLPWPNSGRRVPTLRHVASLGVAIVLATGAIAAFGGKVVERITGPNLLAATVAQRYATYQVATEIIRDHPIIGVGLRGFNDTAAALAPESLYEFGFSRTFIANAQNQVLQTLCDAGILGLISLALFFIATTALLRCAANTAIADAEAFRGYQVWVTGLVLGNQSAVWLIPFSIIPLLFFTVVGLALAGLWLRNTAMRAEPRVPRLVPQ